MIYRRPGFLVVLWFGSPPPSHLPSTSSLSFSVFLWVPGRAYWREWQGGAKSYDGEKALPSINHSILSGNSEDRRGENGRKTVRKSGTFLLPSTVPAYVLYRTQTIWKTKLSLRSIQAQWVNVQMLTYIYGCLKKGSTGNPSIFS